MSKQLFGVGVSPEDEAAILQVICPLGRTCISPTPGSVIMKGRLQEGKENTQNCNFRMTLISLGPSSKSHINTETLQNKQLYSNQDAIYEQTATLIEKESPNAARL